MTIRPNHKRRAALFLRNYADRGDFVRGLPCITQRTRKGRRYKCNGRMHASHAVARGGGGVKGSARDLIPQCTSCHEWFGRDPAGYQAALEIDVLEEAARVDKLAEENLGPLACYKCGSYEGHTAMCKTAEAIRQRREQSLSEVVSDKGARTQDSAPGMLPSPSPEARRAPGEGHLSDDDVPPSRWLPPETPRTR